MANWKEKLAEDVKTNSKLVPNYWLTANYDIVPGPNRGAKLKRVKRAMLELVDNVTVNKSTKEVIYENYESNVIDLNLLGNRQITFGLISDTHFNSKYCQLTYLNKFYDICQELGIDTVYHAGDIDEGENMRPGHVYENYTQGADDHVKEIIKNYPYREGITTAFITGNHDASFRKHCGLDIGYSIADKRSDMKYLGRDVATVNLTPKVSLMLKHPWSGTSYALSYKTQKIIEAMETGLEKKPTILAVGHFHKFEYLFYHGIHCFQTGCFQSATPFTIGKGISVSMGGWIVTIDLDENGNMVAITPKAITFTQPIIEDYKNWQ